MELLSERPLKMDVPKLDLGKGVSLLWMQACESLHSWRHASIASELRDAPTAIKEKEGLSSKPGNNIKPDIITDFYQACGKAELLADFKDSLSHASFVDLQPSCSNALQPLHMLNVKRLIWMLLLAQCSGTC